MGRAQNLHGAPIFVRLKAAERATGFGPHIAMSSDGGVLKVWMHASDTLIGRQAQDTGQSALRDRGVSEEAMAGGTHQRAGPHHL